MIADLKPYSKYKSAELDWLGAIPSHWELRPVFGAFQPNRDRNIGNRIKTVLTLSYGQIKIKAPENLRGLVPESFETYQIVKPGDIILRTIDLQNDHKSLRVGMVRDQGIITSAYLALRVVPGINPEYGYQLLNAWDTSKAIYGYGKGLRQNLAFEHFKRMLVPVPPPEEQAAIVDFISWANNKIECAIRAKRKVIALLNEQKKVIIHEAVTRGFKSSVKLKPSGIPRMTDIPEHWDAIALKRVLLRLVDCEHKTAPHVENSNFRVVRTTAIKNGVLQLRGTYFTSESAFRSWTRRGLPEVGDVLFTREAPAGEACVVPSGMNLCLGQRTVLMKVDKEKINSDFLVHMIYGGPPRTAILLASQGSTVSHFNMSDIGSMPILLPPIREQSEIVATLDERTKGINIALQRLESEIHLFLEYRTRLLADVVTGKLKVLDIAKSLPTEWTHERGGNDHSTNSADELELVGEDASI